jgi:hypothetical protein
MRRNVRPGKLADQWRVEHEPTLKQLLHPNWIRRNDRRVSEEPMRFRLEEFEYMMLQHQSYHQAVDYRSVARAKPHRDFSAEHGSLYTPLRTSGPPFLAEPQREASPSPITAAIEHSHHEGHLFKAKDEGLDERGREWEEKHRKPTRTSSPRFQQLIKGDRRQDSPSTTDERLLSDHGTSTWISGPTDTATFLQVIAGASRSTADRPLVIDTNFCVKVSTRISYRSGSSFIN